MLEKETDVRFSFYNSSFSSQFYAKQQDFQKASIFLYLSKLLQSYCGFASRAPWYWMMASQHTKQQLCSRSATA